MCTWANFSAGQLAHAIVVTFLQETCPVTRVTIFRKVQSYDVHLRYIKLLLVKIQFRIQGHFIMNNFA